MARYVFTNKDREKAQERLNESGKRHKFTPAECSKGFWNCYAMHPWFVSVILGPQLRAQAKRRGINVSQPLDLAAYHADDAEIVAMNQRIQVYVGGIQRQRAAV